MTLHSLVADYPDDSHQDSPKYDQPVSRADSDGEQHPETQFGHFETLDEEELSRLSPPPPRPTNLKERLKNYSVKMARLQSRLQQLMEQQE